METPSWLDTEKIRITLDARPILSMGEHPLQRVIDESAMLQTGEICEIITPFPPMPMIEKLKALGFESYTETANDGTVHTFFRK